MSIGQNTATAGTNNDGAFCGNATVALPPPVVGLVKSCTSPNCETAPQSPGNDLTWKITFTGSSFPSESLIVMDTIPTKTDFKIGSISINPGTSGLTSVIGYSNDGGVTWTYVPVSTGGGAPAGYDRNVTHLRVVFTGSLSHIPPNNTGSITFISQIR